MLTLALPPWKVSEVVYCDDAAIPVIAPACDLVHKTTSVFCIAHTVFLSFGLELSYVNGKSNALPLFCGPESIKAKQELASNSYTSEFEFFNIFVNSH